MANLELSITFSLAVCVGGYVVQVDRKRSDGDWTQDSHVCLTHEEVIRHLKATLMECDEAGDEFKKTILVAGLNEPEDQP